MKMLRTVLLGSVMALTGCSSSPGWHWEHPQQLNAAQLERDLYDCKYYASITDTRAFASDHPIIVFEWDDAVRECMAQRGWIFVDPTADLLRTDAKSIKRADSP